MHSWWRVAYLVACVPIVACGGQSTSHHSAPSGDGGSAGTSTGGSAGSGAMPPGEGWILQPGDVTDDQAYAVGVDANDDVLVLRVRGLEGNARVATLEKYGRNGQLAWNVEIPDAAPELLAVQPNGDSVLAGTASRTDATGAVLNRVVVTAYDPSGRHRWRSDLDEDDLVAVMALNVDMNGHAFLLWTQVAFHEANNNILTELDEAGNVLSSASTSDPGTVYESAIDRRGNLLEAGGAVDPFVRKHDTQGNELWTTPFGATPSGLYGDDRDTVLAVGLLPDGRGSLVKLDAQGATVFATEFGDEEFTTLVTGDAFGRSYTVGALTPDPRDTWDIQARRFDVDGSVLDTWPLATAAHDQPLAVAADSTGALLIVGLTEGAFPGHTSAGGLDSFVARLVP